MYLHASQLTVFYKTFWAEKLIAHKVHALLHTLYLEVGGWHVVAEFLGTVRALTSDFGTEASLADMMDIDLTALFPWTETASVPNFNVPQEMSDAFQASADEPQAAVPDALGPFLETREMENGETHLFLPRLFPLGLQVPGALHVLHHAVEEITTAFENYESWFLPALKAVVQVMGKKFVRERFMTDLRTPDGTVPLLRDMLGHSKVLRCFRATEGPEPEGEPEEEEEEILPQELQQPEVQQEDEIPEPENPTEDEEEQVEPAEAPAPQVRAPPLWDHRPVDQEPVPQQAAAAAAAPPVPPQGGMRRRNRGARQISWRDQGVMYFAPTRRTAHIFN